MVWCPHGGPAATQHACEDENVTVKDLKRPIGAVSIETLLPRVSAGVGSRSSTDRDVVLLAEFCSLFSSLSGLMGEKLEEDSSVQTSAAATAAL